MHEVFSKENRPFKVGWSYKLTIAINCIVSLIGIACLVFTGVYSAQHVVDGGSLAPLIIASVALILMGVMCGLTGVFHFSESNIKHREPSFAYAIIAGSIAFAVGIALILLAILSNTAYVMAHTTAFIIVGIIFLLIGLMSIGVSGWFVGHRHRVLEKEGSDFGE